MKSNIYTVFDIKAKVYTLPFYAMNHEVAIRSFRQKVNEPGHQFNLYPEDYALYFIGSFDDQNAILTPEHEHDTLGKAIEYVNPKNS